VLREGSNCHVSCQSPLSGGVVQLGCQWTKVDRQKELRIHLLVQVTKEKRATFKRQLTTFSAGTWVFSFFYVCSPCLALPLLRAVIADVIRRLMFSLPQASRFVTNWPTVSSTVRVIWTTALGLYSEGRDR
jgi:hypothetical protein